MAGNANYCRDGRSGTTGVAMSSTKWSNWSRKSNDNDELASQVDTVSKRSAMEN